MPHIGAVMERSLQGEMGFREAFVGLVARSVTAALEKRQIGGISNSITDATTAFSSWDNCMAANFCKYVGSMPALCSLFHEIFRPANRLQVACHWRDHICQSYCPLYSVVLRAMSLLWSIVLLRVLLLPEVLWQLLWYV
jgi:hypothetical protein